MSSGNSDEINVKEGRMLSVFLLSIAKESLFRCKTIFESAEIDKTAKEQSEILSIFILVSAALEAFINEFCSDKINEIAEINENKSQKLILEYIYEHAEIREKWFLIPYLLWGKSYDKSVKPWQDFDALISIRNDIMHYKGEYHEIGYTPKYLSQVQQLLTKHSDNTHTRLPVNDLHYTERICNMNMAKWAFNTSIEMINKLLTFADDETRLYYAIGVIGFKYEPLK